MHRRRPHFLFPHSGKADDADIADRRKDQLTAQCDFLGIKLRIRLLCRKPSTEFEKLLGYMAEPEMVHRDNLVLAQGA